MQKTWQRLVIVIAVIALVQIACALQGTRVKQNGYSMKPNYTDGDVFRVEEIPLADLKRFDLVIVENNGNLLLKRLIGFPNETVFIEDGIVYVNDLALDEPYEVVEAVYSMDEVQLDNDSYFILGDNRADSLDSRQIGPVKGDVIKGKAIPE